MTNNQHGQVPDAHNTTAIPGAAAEQLFIPAGWNKAGGSNPPLYTAAQVAALTAAPGVQPLSDGQIASACMSYRHDFGLLEPDERAKIMFTAREWERAFSKEREWTAPAQPAEGAADGFFLLLPQRPKPKHSPLPEATTAQAAPAAGAVAGSDDLSGTLRRLDSKELAAWVDRGMALSENLAMYVQADCTLRESQARDMLRAHLFSAQPAPAAPTPASQAADSVPAMSDAARDLLAERARQVQEEGWTPEHDDEHSCGEMAEAAACYAASARVPTSTKRRQCPGYWPWAAKWWKPSDQRRDLIKAGALILAELERIDRAASKQGANHD